MSEIVALSMTAWSGPEKKREYFLSMRLTQCLRHWPDDAAAVAEISSFGSHRIPDGWILVVAGQSRGL